MKFSAVILAGGKSSRMGRDKAWLEVDGQPLLARQIQLVRQLGPEEVFISGRAGTDYAALGCPILHDRFPDAGPLGGIESALERIRSPLLLVLAVDMPNMTADALSGLAAHCTEAAGVIPRICGRYEPLAAFYPKTAWPLAKALLATDSKAATNFAEHCVQSKLANVCDLSAADARLFTNWNNPEDIK